MTTQQDPDIDIRDDADNMPPFLELVPEPVIYPVEGTRNKDLAGSLCNNPFGLMWDASQNSMKFLDSDSKKYHSIDVDTLEHNSVSLGDDITFVAVEATEGNLLVGDESSVHIVDVNDKNEFTRKLLVHLPPDIIANGGRITTGKVSPYGELYIGVGGGGGVGGKGGAGDLLRVVVPKSGARSDKYTLEKAIYASHVMNTPRDFAWDHGGRSMYIADSRGRCLIRYVSVPFRQTLENRETIFDFSKSHIDASPSSLAVDRKGNVWVALDGSGELINVSASKRTDQAFVVARIKTPFSRINSIAFGGQSLQDLYVAGMDSDSGESAKGRIGRGRIVKYPLLGTLACVCACFFVL
jgi:sugar lactone lactonase YvrE